MYDLNYKFSSAISHSKISCRAQKKNNTHSIRVVYYNDATPFHCFIATHDNTKLVIHIMDR